jgi:peptide subunit release factor RF-3
MSTLTDEIARRRTFAIISHLDAGKRERHHSDILTQDLSARRERLAGGQPERAARARSRDGALGVFNRGYSVLPAFPHLMS